ncbi:MAG: PLDc_N domain-containing protein [Dehalococcoidia bacterium]|nr:MAG: PLDc_N domain-containing protein [Dehalococcoidia bacterium]
MILALVDLIQREKVKGNNKVLWALLIVLVNIIGPVVYLIIGREE